MHLTVARIASGRSLNAILTMAVFEGAFSGRHECFGRSAEVLPVVAESMFDDRQNAFDGRQNAFDDYGCQTCL